MHLSEESLKIIENSQPPRFFRITVKGDTIKIIDKEGEAVFGDILIYAQDITVAYDFVVDYRNTIESLFFMDANTKEIVQIVQRENIPQIEDLYRKISELIKNFEHRPEQLKMAREIYRCLKEGKMGIFEAPTGTGKSIAYLMASVLFAKKYKKRVIISTNTINLQRQLIEKDLPVLSAVLDFRVELALGRGNYLCRRRLDNILNRGDVFLFETEGAGRLKSFAERTKTGLRSEFLSEKIKGGEEIWELVNSSSITCAHTRCPYYKSDCFYYRAKALISSADIIIANHHLVISDVVTNKGKVLPQYEAIVFDEAHNLEKNATNYFTKTVSTAQLKQLLSRIYTSRRKKEGGLIELIDNQKTKEEIKAKVEELKELINGLHEKATIGEKTIEENDIENLKKELSPVMELLNGLALSLKPFKDNPDIAAQIRLLDENRELLEEFLREKDPYNVRWIKVTENYIHYNITPISIDSELKERIYSEAESVIFTSATIAVEGNFNFFKRSVGAEDAFEFIMKDNFDYKKSSLLVAVGDAPPPESDNYADFLAEYIKAVAPIIKKTNAGVLVLFTSYSMLNAAYNRAIKTLSKLGLNAMKQGEMDNFEMLKLLKEKRGFLFATSSFWEGIDVKGDALSVVFITRLPFEVPSTPVEKKRYQILNSEGRNAFLEYALPKAVLKFRQGFGRLIRDRNDRGVVVVSDPRIVTKSYGKMFMNSLPDMRKEVINGSQLAKLLDRFFNGTH